MKKLLAKIILAVIITIAFLVIAGEPLATSPTPGITLR
jgi:hypothetical protein